MLQWYGNSTVSRVKHFSIKIHNKLQYCSCFEPIFFHKFLLKKWKVKLWHCAWILFFFTIKCSYSVVKKKNKKNHNEPRTEFRSIANISLWWHFHVWDSSEISGRKLVNRRVGEGKHSKNQYISCYAQNLNILIR